MHKMPIELSQALKEAQSVLLHSERFHGIHPRSCVRWTISERRRWWKDAARERPQSMKVGFGISPPPAVEPDQIQRNGHADDRSGQADDAASSTNWNRFPPYAPPRALRIPDLMVSLDHIHIHNVHDPRARGNQTSKWPRPPAAPGSCPVKRYAPRPAWTKDFVRLLSCCLFRCDPGRSIFAVITGTSSDEAAWA